MFDMAGTLISLNVFMDQDMVVIRELARAIGFDEPQLDRIKRACADSSVNSLEKIGTPKYYLYRDVIATRYMLAARSLGADLDEQQALRFSDMWWRLSVDRFTDLGLRGGGLRTGALETLTALRERGIHVSLVSNIDDREFSGFLEVEDFSSHFDFYISSETAQSCKPDHAIFDIALKQAGCRAEEVIFVGDTPNQDIEGAAAVGMQTVLIQREAVMGISDVKPCDRADHQINELRELLELLD